MQRPHIIWLVAVTIVIVTASVVFLLVTKPKDPVREHLDSVRALEMTWTNEESRQKFGEHMQALVDLGYLETRAFPLRRQWDKAAHKQFRSLYLDVSFSDSPCILNNTGNWPTSVVLIITAGPQDMALWSNVVVRFEQSDPP